MQALQKYSQNYEEKKIIFVQLKNIPQPRGLPVFGNLFQMPRQALVQHFTKLAPQFDGIFDINFVGYLVSFAYSPAIVSELTDADRFRKLVGPPLSMLRALAGDGLFTAHTDEPNWGSAHRVLVAGFGQRAMRSYFDAMLDVSNQLVTKWQASQGQTIDVTADMTRLTFDTIALCGFGYRFRSFDSDQPHPFIGAMNNTLTQTMLRLTRLRIPSLKARAIDKQVEADILLMNQLVDQVIVHRRGQMQAAQSDQPQTKARDLLDLMLRSVDPKTGEPLSDLNMRYQVITFLIAGHETTSGLLSFALFYLLKDPDLMRQAVDEVDRVLGIDQTPKFDDLIELDVIDRLLKETLRLWPTAPVYSVAPFKDTTIAGKYKVKKNHRINILLPGLHRAASVWDNPERFDIDRFLPEREAMIPPHAYKPFGAGERACIGRQFAIAEAKLAIALILQKFTLQDHTNYQLAINETLTLKPSQFCIRANPRNHPRK